MAARQLQDLLDLLEEILSSLNVTDSSGERTLEYLVRRLQEKTRELWQLYEQGKIVTDLRPLTKVLKDYFILELPQAIKDINSREKVKKELKLTKKLIEDLLRPKAIG